MNSRIRMMMLGALLAAAAWPGSGWALTQAEAEQTARLLAILLDSGRIVLAEHQSLINDPARADKGFTGEAFEAMVVEKFKQRTGGLDLAKLDAAPIPERSREFLRALLAAGAEVIMEKQPIINEKHLGYKNVIPATWGTWTTMKFSQRSRLLLKQTALDFRNPHNAPDDFETKVLKQFADPGYPREGERVVSALTDGGARMRLLLPLYHKKDCLACHGTPKGMIDISGYIKEGHQEGGPAGAISVAIPLN